MATLRELEKRDKIESELIMKIHKDYHMSLTEAIGVYYRNPHLKKHIVNDSFPEVEKKDYLGKLYKTVVI